MTLAQLSVEYRSHAAILKTRIQELEQEYRLCRSKPERQALERRIRLLSSMYRDARELAALTEALGTVDTMQITYAARNSDFDGHDIHEGDYLALYGNALFGTNKDIKVLLKALAEKVRDSEKEYITIYYGADVEEKHAQKAADIFADICPNADVNLLCGGQPVYYYLISAE